MRSYILPGLAPSFLFVFVIFWGLVSRDSYGFYEKKEGKKKWSPTSDLSTYMVVAGKGNS